MDLSLANSTGDLCNYGIDWFLHDYNWVTDSIADWVGMRKDSNSYDTGMKQLFTHWSRLKSFYSVSNCFSIFTNNELSILLVM